MISNAPAKENMVLNAHLYLLKYKIDISLRLCPQTQMFVAFCSLSSSAFAQDSIVDFVMHVLLMVILVDIKYPASQLTMHMYICVYMYRRTNNGQYEC